MRNNFSWVLLNIINREIAICAINHDIIFSQLTGAGYGDNIAWW